jgi:ribosomal protein L37E
MKQHQPAHFQCPDCGRISYHPVDIREGWCNVCKRGDLERLLELQRKAQEKK